MTSLPGPWVIWYQGKPVLLLGGIAGAIENGFRWQHVKTPAEATQFDTMQLASTYLEAIQFPNYKSAEIAPLRYDGKDHPSPL
jgi:hypothetical protein